jgi:hypothetical protein
MRIAIIALCLSTGMAWGQTTPQADPAKDSQNTTGRTAIPEKKEQGQPRGNPRNTGGVPASGLQGETPSSSQSAPKDSSKEAK